MYIYININIILCEREREKRGKRRKVLILSASELKEVRGGEGRDSGLVRSF